MAIKHFELSPNRPKDPHADKRILDTKNGFFGFFIKRYRLVFIILAGIIGVGTLSLMSLPREADPEVKIPIAIRFAWRNGALPNLFNSAGLPASSFRTDGWPGVTINNK